MKKVLAAVLTVIMLFAALSVVASAENYGSADFWDESTSSVMDKTTYLEDTQRVIHFVLNSGTIVSGAWVYDIDGTGFTYKPTYKAEDYFMLPDNRPYSEADRQTGKLPHTPGTTITLPNVAAPSGSTFRGWQHELTGRIYVAGSSYTIDPDSDRIITFKAYFVPEELEEDTMGNVMDILVKVFSSIVGLLFFSDQGTDAIDEGMKLVNKLIGGLFE